MALSVALCLATSACGFDPFGPLIDLYQASSQTSRPTTLPVRPKCVPTTPVSCLMPTPAGKHPWPVQPLPEGVITATQFVDHLYPSYTQQELLELGQQGIRAIAHEDCNGGANADVADVYVLQFGDLVGAQSRYLGVTGATEKDATQSVITLSGLTPRYDTILVFASKSMDDKGFMHGAAYAWYGQLEIEFFFSSPATLDTTMFSS